MTLTLTPDQTDALRRLLAHERHRPTSSNDNNVAGRVAEWAADERALRDVLAMLTRPTRSAA
jgi:hypothetical protein